MSNSIKKKLPFDNMKISEIEAWLNEMAQNGRILQKFRVNKVIFAEEEITDAKYKVLAIKDFSMEDRREILKKGWDRVAENYDVFDPDITINTIRYYTFVSVDGKKRDDITGDVFDEEYLKKVYKKNRNKVIGSFFMMLILVAFYFFAIITDASYNIHEIVGDITVALLTCIPYLSIIFSLLSFKSKKDEIMEYADNEVVVNTQADKVDRVLRWGTLWIFLGLFLGLFIFTIASCGYRSINENNVDLREIDNFVSIMDIEDDGNVLLQTTGEIADCYTGSSETNFIITNHYTINNYFKKLPKASYDAGVYYDANYYETQFEFLTELAYNRWIEHHGKYESIKNPLQYTQSECFNKIAYKYYECEDNRDHIYICFMNENEFLEITYNGEKTPQEIIIVVDKICSKQ